jgi:hypothetical protein
LLTLIVVPVVYAILDDFSAWLFRNRKKAAPVAAMGLLIGALVAGAARPVEAAGRRRNRQPRSRSRPLKS